MTLLIWFVICVCVLIGFIIIRNILDDTPQMYYDSGYNYAAGRFLSGKWNADTTWSSDCTSYDDGVQQALRDWKALNTHRTIERRKHRGQTK